MTAADLDLCYMSALDALAAFKARTLSPVELMKAVIARCEAVNPALNLVTYSYFERALEQAKAAEARYGKTDGRLRALEGLPFASKDYHAIKGEITTIGSKIMEHNRPDHTYPVTERLMRAGAILHIRTTTPEFGYAGTSHSPLWGVSRNPWNAEYTPGGSSGGSGGAVAAGMTTIADGGDGGGSIRIPASVNGLFGFKPPYGAQPQRHRRAPCLPRPDRRADPHGGGIGPASEHRLRPPQGGYRLPQDSDSAAADLRRDRGLAHRLFTEPRLRRG